MDYNRLLYIILGVLAVAALILIVNHDAGQSLGMDNSKFVSLVMLGSIGVVIGMSVMTRGGFTGGGLRMAAVWLCLILALMVAYQFLARHAAGELSTPKHAARIRDRGFRFVDGSR